MDALPIGDACVVGIDEFEHVLVGVGCDDVLEHPVGLRVGERTVVVVDWTNEAPVDLVILEEFVVMQGPTEEFACIVVAASDLHFNGTGFGEPMRNAVLSH